MQSQRELETSIGKFCKNIESWRTAFGKYTKLERVSRTEQLPFWHLANDLPSEARPAKLLLLQVTSRRILLKNLLGATFEAHIHGNSVLQLKAFKQ